MTRTRSYTEIAEKLDRFKEMAKAVHLSQMIPGIKDVDMAFMVLMECEVTGQTVFEWDQLNHIVCGRPAMKYDAMIAAYNSLPDCQAKLLEKTPEKASVLLIDGEDEMQFTLTWEDAQREPWVYEGKESDNVAILAKGQTPPRIKAKYATPRSRAIMLYARCVSDAIRTTRPEVTKGRYTPEEIEDFDVIDSPRVTEVKQPELSDPKRLVAPKSPAVPSTPQPIEAKQVEHYEEPEQPATETPSEVTVDDDAGESLDGKTSINVNGPCSDDQVTTIRSMLADLKKEGHDLIGAVKAVLAAHKINGLAGLSFDEARRLVAALERKSIENWATETLKGPTSPA